MTRLTVRAGIPWTWDLIGGLLLLAALGVLGLLLVAGVL